MIKINKYNFRLYIGLFISAACFGELSFAQSSSLTEKSFKIVIPSYNNELWCEQNVLSILDQNYKNYHIFYINDCSTDRTLEIVEHIRDTHHLGDKITIINNKLRGGPLRNVYMPINFLCEDDDLVIVVDGDDWLIGEDVLADYNEMFSKNDLWFIYGNSRRSDEPKESQPVASNCIYSKDKIGNSVRSSVWVKHPRVFYAWLFKSIRLESLLYKGQFLPAAGDAGFIYPMLELSGHRQLFNTKVTYIYNQGNPLSHFTIIPTFELSLNDFVLQQKPYKVCDKPMKNKKDVSCISTFLIVDEITEDLKNVFFSFDSSKDPRDVMYVLYDPEKISKRRLKKIAFKYPSIILYSCVGNYAAKIQTILQTKSPCYPKFIFITSVEGYLRNQSQVQLLSQHLQQSAAHVAAYAVTHLGHEGSFNPLSGSSYIYGNLFSMQLEYEPQLPLPYSIDGLVYPVLEFTNHNQENTPLFTDKLELIVQTDDKIKNKAGYIALSNWE